MRGWIRTAVASSLLLCCTASAVHAQTGDSAVARLRGRDAWRTDFSRRTVPLREIRSGGVPREGIPAVDRPEFESADAAAGWLADRDLVLVVEHEGAARAYPFRILVWHEIVNDQLAGLPLAVTFCPLCNTSVVFDRRVGARTLDFGVTGRLRHSDLVMFDRQSETWWQQAIGEGIVGAMAGTKLRRVPARILTWETAREQLPSIRVLSRPRGSRLDYTRNPFAGYDDPGRHPLRRLFARSGGPALPPLERVVAVDLGSGWAASARALRQSRVANATVERTPIVVFWRDAAQSGSRTRGTGADLGQTAAYDRRVAGRVLTFRARGNTFEDRETGSRWDLAGRAITGPLRGRRLRGVPHDNPFWFAWVAFRPATRLWIP